LPGIGAAMRIMFLMIVALQVSFMIFCILCQFWILTNFFDEYKTTDDFGRFFSIIITFIFICLVQLIFTVMTFSLRKICKIMEKS